MARKTRWYLGSASLAMTAEQERRHWLNKTDKNKSVQDIVTGDIFRGRIDNLGSDIIVETEKLPLQNPVVQNASFESDAVANVFQTATASLPFIPQMNGLMMLRITSLNLTASDASDAEVQHNFRLILQNCDVIHVPIVSPIGDAFVYTWLRTTTTPLLERYNPLDDTTDRIPVTFATGVTNPVFYYPLDEELQPLPLSEDTDTYITDMATDESLIGYPLVWFTCDESDMGPKCIILNNDTNDPTVDGHVFETGWTSQSKYSQVLYPCIGTNGYNGPASITDSSYLDNEYLYITCQSDMFTGDVVDFSRPIQTIGMVKRTGGTEETWTAQMSSDHGNNLYYMIENSEWIYNDTSHTYEIQLSNFNDNCIDNVEHNPLIPIIRIVMDRTVNFDVTTTDVGYSGFSFGSSRNYFDQYPRYPHDIEKLDGLPDWVKQTDENSSPQHLSVYAIHNTVDYNPDDQNTRQIAGLIFDPGQERSYSEQEDEPIPNEEIGRVYYLSNDDPEYRNNARLVEPKPPRTLARICDIPTSVMQLSGIHGIAPTSVVDKKYVRSEAPFTEASLERLYNGVRDKWVKPTHLDRHGQSIYPTSNSNQFIFDSVEALSQVDLSYHNDFREIIHLNPTVDPTTDVELYAIAEPGSGYYNGQIGVCVVGGYAFHYEITEVNGDGGVVSLMFSAGDNQPINLANFDMSGTSDHTIAYGTSPLEASQGTGLKIQFRIRNYYERLTKKSSIVDGLYAFVKTYTGIWLYSYNNQTFRWNENTLIAEANVSDPATPEGNVSVREAYINSVIPSIRALPVALKSDVLGQSAIQDTLRVLQTPTFINVIDNDKTPVQIPSDSESTEKERTIVDISTFYCYGGIKKLNATSKTAQAVIDALYQNKVDCFDTFVFWKWVYPTISTNYEFEYGIVQRSFNNLMSNEATSYLPENELRTKSMVHSNPSTTIVWNVPHVGPMMWVYDPNYTIHEKYFINAHTRELYIIKEEMTWSKVKIVSNPTTGETINLCDNNGILRYNILTNNPVLSQATATSPIYQQPSYRQLPDSYEGATNPTARPTGNWRLVFPEIHTFRLVGNGNEYTPTPMQIIRGTNVDDDTDVLDFENQPVNYKTLIVTETEPDPSEGDSVYQQIKLKMYNQETGRWDII